MKHAMGGGKHGEYGVAIGWVDSFANEIKAKKRLEIGITHEQLRSRKIFFNTLTSNSRFKIKSLRKLESAISSMARFRSHKTWSQWRTDRQQRALRQNSSLLAIGHHSERGLRRMIGEWRDWISGIPERRHNRNRNRYRNPNTNRNPNPNPNSTLSLTLIQPYP